MSGRSARVLQEALSLPPTERAELVEQLLSSLDPPLRKRIDDFWAVEAEDRIDAFERRELESYPANEVFEEVKHER
jgi:putative addiction module component (TIGR02574 family)